MADDADLKGHVKTYDGMIAFLKWGAGAAALVTLLVMWLMS